jgi:FixJ family two-component response regulator
MGSDVTLFLVDSDDACWPAMRNFGESLDLNVATYDSGQKFLRELRDDQLGCMVSEFRVWDISGLHILDKLREEESPLPLIFVSAHATIALAVRALRAGATDVFEKPPDEAALAETIQQAVCRCRALLPFSAQRRRFKERLQTLSHEEQDILKGLWEFDDLREIANHLNVSRRTAQLRRQRVLQKLGVESSRELIDVWRELLPLDTRRGTSGASETSGGPDPGGRVHFDPRQSEFVSRAPAIESNA